MNEIILKKNQIIELEIIDNGGLGEGIGKFNGNYVVFVPKTIIGEIVEVQIIKITKTYAIGKLLKIIKASKYRTDPTCPVYGKCGGCDLQHLNYEHQLSIKTNSVKNTLGRTLKDIEVMPCIASPCIWAYRNKMILPIRKEGIGFYANFSHRVIPILNCSLHDTWNEILIKCIKEFIDSYKITLYDDTTHTGALKHVVARYIDNSLLVTLVINADKLKNIDKFADILKRNFDSYGLYININKQHNNVILTEDIKYISGKKVHITEDFSVKHEVSPLSFLQVNREVQNLAYQQILDNIDSDSIVIDAFSGAGLLTAIMSKKCKHAYGIEIIKDATINADKLAIANNIENITNINGDCAIELPKLIQKLKGDKINVVLDPPRKGCDEETIKSILESLPTKIVYLSCNPATLARDLDKLLIKYKIDFIQPYDMFPQTKHVETLVSLSLKI